MSDREEEVASQRSAREAPWPEAVRRVWERLRYLVRRLGHVGPLAVLTVALPLVGGLTLVNNLEEVGAFLETYEAAAIAVFIAAAAVMGAASLLPTHGLSALGGFVFGFVTGVPVTMAAIVIGAGLGYAVKRLISRQRVMGLIGEKPEAKAVHAALVHGGFSWSVLVVTLIRLSPMAPFAATNLLMAATGVKVPAFLIGTAVGMLPRCAAVVAVGHMLAQVGQAEHAAEVWALVGGMIATVAAVVVLGSASRRALRRVTNRPM